MINIYQNVEISTMKSFAITITLMYNILNDNDLGRRIMKYQCKLVDDETARYVLSIKTTTTLENLSKTLSQCYSAIEGYLYKMGEHPLGAPFVAFHSNDTDNLVIEAGYPVSKLIAGKGDIIASELPTGKKVSCTYMGPYEKIKPDYDDIMAWMKKHNFKPKGISYEFYRGDPTEVAQEELETEVVIPIH